MTMYEMEANHLLAIEHERLMLTQSGRLSKRMELICRYDIPDKDGEWKRWSWGDEKDATKAKISELNLEAPSRLTVWYDFGDDWKVSVYLEKIFCNPDIPVKELPRVLEGKGFGIIEDCGGIYGLEDLTQAFKAKKGEDYERYREWLGCGRFGYDGI